jgi:hypothetical protein
VLALSAALLGNAFHRATLRAHAVAYLLVMMVEGGFLAGAVGAFAGQVEPPWGAIRASGWLGVACAVVCYGVLAAIGWQPPHNLRDRLPHLGAAILATLAVGTLGVLALLRVVAGPNGYRDVAVLATVRTIVLSAAAVVLALLGRRARFQQLAWLVYPVLILCGVKLLVQDLPQGRAATLVLAFVAYGVALILAPRLLRRDRPVAP